MLNWQTIPTQVRGKFALKVFLFSCLANFSAFDLFGAKFRIEHLTWPLLFFFIFQNKSIERRASNNGIKSAKRFLILWVSIALFSSGFLAKDSARSFWVAYQISIGVIIFVRLSNSSLTNVVLVEGKRVILFFLELHAIIFLLTPVRNFLPNTFFSLDQRFIGLTYEANVLAGIATFWIAIEFVKSDKHQFGFKTRIDLAVCLLLIFASGTRAAFIATMLIAIVILIERVKSQKYLSLIVSFYGLCLFLTSLITLNLFRILTDSQTLLSRISSAFDFNAETLLYRIKVYEIAISDIRESEIIYKIFGRGLNSFSQVHQIDISRVEDAYLSNLPLAIMYDSGILGLICFTLFIAILISATLRVDRTSIAFWLVLIIATSTTNMFWFSFLWLFMTLISGSTGNEKANSNQPIPKSISDTL
jgi:hypothetical protein